MPSHSKAPPRSGGKRRSREADLAARQRELYALPPDQFTRARDALAKEFASKGKAKDAQAVRKLKRPVVAAWVINRLAQQHPERLEAFLTSARTLEKAHRQAMSGVTSAALKEATRAFQQSLDALLKELNASLAATGRPATGDLIRQAEETLRAAALGTEEERSALVQGTLTRPLQSSGFGSFSPLLLVGPAPGSAAPAPAPSEGGKVLRGPWAPPSHAPKRRAASPPPRAPKRPSRDESAAEARRQREAELRQLRREAKQQASEAARAERSARQSVVRTQAVLRTTQGKTLAARRALESAEARVLRAREALEAAEELAARAREDLERAEESERAQAEEATRADEEASAAERALTEARRQLE